MHAAPSFRLHANSSDFRCHTEIKGCIFIYFTPLIRGFDMAIPIGWFSGSYQFAESENIGFFLRFWISPSMSSLTDRSFSRAISSRICELSSGRVSVFFFDIHFRHCRDRKMRKAVLDVYLDFRFPVRCMDGDDLRVVTNMNDSRYPAGLIPLMTKYPAISNGFVTPTNLAPLKKPCR